MSLRGEPTVWIKHVAQLCMYRWNKSKSLLERNFRCFGVDWDRRMVNELGNSTDDSSEGSLGRCESAGPSHAPSINAGGDGSDNDNEEDPEEDPERETEGTKPREKCSS